MQIPYDYLQRDVQRRAVSLRQPGFLSSYCFAVAGYIMELRSSGRPGDQVTLTSTLHEFQRPVSLTVDYRLEKFENETSSTLSVYLLSTRRVPLRLTFVPWDTFEWGTGLTGGWRRACVYIPNGSYYVMFVATLGKPYHSDVYLDRIEFRSEHACNRNIDKPTGNFIFCLTGW